MVVPLLKTTCGNPLPVVSLAMLCQTKRWQTHRRTGSLEDQGKKVNRLSMCYNAFLAVADWRGVKGAVTIRYDGRIAFKAVYVRNLCE